MTTLLWDASTLAKRYSLEAGSDVTNVIFASQDRFLMLTTPWGYAEVFSILVRAKNRGTVHTEEFRDAISSLQFEVLGGTIFQFLEVAGPDVVECTALISVHNLNATDAAILTVLLNYARLRSKSSDQLVLIACDKRFLRAADAEGLKTLNPELLSPETAMAQLVAF